nr:MAG TPA: HGWP repeat [Caudoviricetes sp.]
MTPILGVFIFTSKNTINYLLLYIILLDRK